MSALFRWNKKPEPCEFEFRVVRKRLIFPKLLGDEWRWLGVEDVRQIYCAWGWMDWEWADARGDQNAGP